MRLIKLEYCLTLSILVYDTSLVISLLFIYSHWKLLLKNMRPNAHVIVCFLSQVNEDVYVRFFSCLTIHMREEVGILRKHLTTNHSNLCGVRGILEENQVL